MRFIADFHIHSKYSRAVSKNMILEELDAWADDKGILVMGTGDFTHPLWFRELEEKLAPAEAGLYKLKEQHKKNTIKGTKANTRFLLTVEISSIYSRGGKTRRIHNLVFAPDLETVKKINTRLSLVGNLKSDGRPILGLDSEELAKIVFNINPEAAIVPAHAWTPWFAVFGSMSGFDSLEECFGAYAKNIFAVETGLSSDPAMNWRLKNLDDVALISNSDSHSLERIGREANIFNTELSYKGIIDAIKSGSPNNRAKNPEDKRFVATIEFFPEEGKYHYDGHRLCGVSWTPEETKKNNKICPKCGKPVTVGVMNRVYELSDRKVEPEKTSLEQVIAWKYENRVPYVNMVTLDEIIGEAFQVGPKTKTVRTEYGILIKAFGSELKILMKVPGGELEAVANPKVVKGISLMREAKLRIKPGFDGEFGKVKIFGEEEEKIQKEPQKHLF